MTRNTARYLRILLMLLAAEAGLVIVASVSAALRVFLRHSIEPGFIAPATVALTQAIVDFVLLIGMPLLATWAGGLLACRMIGGSSHAVLWSVVATCIGVALATFYGTLTLSLSALGDI